jgi:methionyl-tRNA formyltransferase
VARLAYLGSPDAAVAPLEALVAAGHHVTLVVSRADARRGRGTTRSASPVKRAALDLGLAVTDDLGGVTDAGAELGVVVAYGRIIPSGVLDALAMVNVHFSLLPRWRGAAPVERAVLAGDTRTGVSLMRLDAGLDTGPVVATAPVEIEPGEHVGSLTRRLSDTGAQLLVDALADGVGALGAGRAQTGPPTYAEKITPDELRLDWERPAHDLERVVRLDRAWTTWRGERLRILEAVAVDGAGLAPGARRDTLVGTGAGQLRLLSVQPAGRRPMAADAWGRGIRVGADERLGAPGDAR